MRNTIRLVVGLVGLLLAAPLLAAGCAPETRAPHPGRATLVPATPSTAAPSATMPQSRTPSTPSRGESTPDCDEICQKARQQLAEKEGVPVDAVRIVAVEQVTWPDACLGIKAEGMVCAQVLTPGQRIILEVGGVKHAYHTSLRGTIREAPKP